MKLASLSVTSAKSNIHGRPPSQVFQGLLLKIEPLVLNTIQNSAKKNRHREGVSLDKKYSHVRTEQGYLFY